jgi:hypothetical protein
MHADQIMKSNKEKKQGENHPKIDLSRTHKTTQEK